MKINISGDKYTFKDIDPNSRVTINGRDWRDIVKEGNKPSKYTLKNIWSFLQGHARYKLFYSKFAFIIPKHIREQIQIRINSMDRQCYEEGQCKLCGCQTTQLQMANKACDKPCYPKMIPKRTWRVMKEQGFYIESIGFKNNISWNLVMVDGKYQFMPVGYDLCDSYDNGKMLPQLDKSQEDWVDEDEKVLQSVDLANQKEFNR